MNTLRNFFWATLALVTTVVGAVSAETNVVKLTAPPTNPGRLYSDTFLSAITPNFIEGDYLSGVGVGYQITKHWGADVRLVHYGLDEDGSLVQGIGPRLVARMPFEFLSPYTFLGASFDLERDLWHLQPGAGIELGVSKKLRGLSIFAEGGIDTRLEDGALRDPGWLFTGGLRLRF